MINAEIKTTCIIGLSVHQNRKRAKETSTLQIWGQHKAFQLYEKTITGFGRNIKPGT
jgi:hypothetical protein